MVEGLLPVTEGQQEGQSCGLGNPEPDSSLGSINNGHVALGSPFLVRSSVSCYSLDEDEAGLILL